MTYFFAQIFFCFAKCTCNEIVSILFIISHINLCIEATKMRKRKSCNQSDEQNKIELFKKKPLCQHEEPRFRPCNLTELHSKCSIAAYLACCECILYFSKSIIKKTEEQTKRSKAFVCECICCGHASIDQKFIALQLCHRLGFPFPFAIFEFENNFSKEQSLWLIQKGTPVCIIIDELIQKRWWKHIKYSVDFNYLYFIKKPLDFFLISDIISIILYYVGLVDTGT